MVYFLLEVVTMLILIKKEVERGIIRGKLKSGNLKEYVVKMFLWRVGNNILPTRSNLYSRRKYIVL